MSSKLIKIAKELNVGIETLAEFLQKKGFDAKPSPNYAVDDEQEEILNREFNSDRKLKKESEKVTQQRREKSKNESVAIEGYEKEIKTEVPAEQQPKMTILGKINLDEVGKKPKNKSQEQNAAAPKNEQKPAEASANASVANNETSAPVVNKDASDRPAAQNNEVFEISKPTISNNINVVGKIDLDALNQQTRPKKKNKNDRNNHSNQNQKGGQQNASGNNGQNQDNQHKRRRIQNGNEQRVDVNNFQNQKNGGKGNNQNGGNNNNNQNGGKNRNKHNNQKQEISDEEISKQVKENLAKLTSKSKEIKSAQKHRHEKREQMAQQRAEQEEQNELEKSILKITEFVTVSELATMMKVPVAKVIGTCMNLGIMVSINQRLDAETINVVADEFGFQTEYVSAEVSEAIAEEEDAPEDLVSRPPVVTVMGHVDHGKTSLLDYIRKTNVIAGEAGGITQHIGAYNVTLPNGQQITFLDTPGHEAFTAMRARGAQVADVAIIIVAADDDVMPQTIEAINHASTAGVPIVFAINKIDKPTANPDKIKEALAAMNYLVEDWGGKYQCQEIAAKKGTGVEELMEKVLLEAEMLDLKANPNRKASGIIIESKLDKGRGYTSNVLVNNGTLRVGDVIVAGTNYGKVKAMFNERGQKVSEVKPAQPALVLGLNGAPQAGDKINVMDSDQEAREIATKREQLQREQGLRTSTRINLEEIGRRIALGDFHEMNIIIKGDVDGSVQALHDSLLKLSTEQIQINVIHTAVGQISESDVMLATASNAIIVGFQVRPSQAARKIAEQEKVDIRLYSIIYDAIEQIKDAMQGMLSPEIREEVTGTAEVQSIFKISKVGTIAGCMVREGKVKRTSKVRVIREGIVVHTGALASLKRFKDDAKEVTLGQDCGLNIANYNDIMEGDVIEAFDEIEVARKL